VLTLHFTPAIQHTKHTTSLFLATQRVATQPYSRLRYPTYLFYLLFNERYWAPVFASQVLTEEPGLTWVAFTLNSSNSL
jgi:hypothetical protein